jgi:hypothetical protein
VFRQQSRCKFQTTQMRKGLQVYHLWSLYIMDKNRERWNRKTFSPLTHKLPFQMSRRKEVPVSLPSLRAVYLPTFSANWPQIFPDYEALSPFHAQRQWQKWQVEIARSMEVPFSHRVTRIQQNCKRPSIQHTLRHPVPQHPQTKTPYQERLYRHLPPKSTVSFKPRFQDRELHPYFVANNQQASRWLPKSASLS